MTTVLDVLKFVETLAPRYMKMDFDNVGLLCGRKDKEVKKILVALDPFQSVIEEAIEEKADLIVTHHPLIYRDPPMAINEDSQTGRNLLLLIENGIAAINAHTNLDQAPGGVNDVLAEAVGLRDIRVITPAGQDAQGRDWGLLHMGVRDELTLEDFLAYVKEHLHCDGLRYVSGGKNVRTVAVGGGSCADGIYEALEAGCDTLVTSDVKYNQFRTAYEMGLNLIDAGHFHTENPVMPVLAARLQEAFPEVEVKFSEKHTDCMKFFR